MDFWRQQDFISPSDLEIPITLIGVGGIGSLLLLALAKMGCSNLTIYDDDKVEVHNIPNQFYRQEDLDQFKVEAQTNIISEFAGTEIKGVNERFLGQKSLEGIVISAVDKMSSRKEIWEKAIVWKPGVSFYIDGRMGGEVLRIFTVRPCDPDDVTFYEKSLHSDEEGAQIPCTAQAIIDVVFFTAGFMANQVRRFAKGEETSREIIFDLRTMSLINRKSSGVLQQIEG